MLTRLDVRDDLSRILTLLDVRDDSVPVDVIGCVFPWFQLSADL